LSSHLEGVVASCSESGRLIRGSGVAGQNLRAHAFARTMTCILPPKEISMPGAKTKSNCEINYAVDHKSTRKPCPVTD
jgi:hypothetical protein